MKVAQSIPPSASGAVHAFGIDGRGDANGASAVEWIGPSALVQFPIWGVAPGWDEAAPLALPCVRVHLLDGRAGEADERRIGQSNAQIAGEAVGHLAGLFIHLAAKPYEAICATFALTPGARCVHFVRGSAVTESRLHDVAAKAAQVTGGPIFFQWAAYFQTK